VLITKKARYVLATLITISLPVFYILFNVGTPRYILLPKLHIYGTTTGLFLLALSLVFYIQFIKNVSVGVLLLLSSWTVQNIGVATYGFWNPSLKTDSWQPLPFWEAFWMGFGPDSEYWLIVLIPALLCVLLVRESDSVVVAHNKKFESDAKNARLN